MVFRQLIDALAHALFKRDVDVLFARALELNESGKLSNKDHAVFAEMASRYRYFLLD